MAIFVFKDAKLFLDSYDMSGDSNQCSLNITREALDKTVWGNDTRLFSGGLHTIGFSASGFQQHGSGLIDPVLSSKLGVSNSVLTVAGDGADDGDICYLLQALESEYSPFSNSVGDLAAFSMVTVGSGYWSRGRILIPKAAYTTTANGTAYQLGAVAAGKRVHASLHVFSASAGDTLDVIVESDSQADFLGSAETQITFAQVSAAGSQYLVTDGSAITDDYWRVGFTIAGDGSESFTFAVAVGIS